MASPTVMKLASAWDTLRHDGAGWPLFLSSVSIDGLRGWGGETVEFRFPVVAIAGVNGAGKSTILKSAAAAYKAPSLNGAAKTFYADDFFPSTPWEVVEGVSITYSMREGDSTKAVNVRKPTSRWRGAPDRLTRPSFFLDVSRIQPANTQIGYGRTAQDVISQGATELLAGEDVARLNRIMGRVYDTASFDRKDDKQVGVVSLSGISYSNFHQGAGEDSALDLVGLVSQAPNKSLILIDEVEASLHPQAQRGLVTELLRLAHDKRLQIVLSTHSPYILEQLPDVARVFVSVDRDMKRQVLYGVTTDFALNLMDNERHEELDIYCEDDGAAYVIERLVSVGAPEQLSRVRITAVGPASTVMALGRVASEGKMPRNAVCVVDADQPDGNHYQKLPGSRSPERELYGSLSESDWGIVAERLGRPGGELLDAVEAAMQIENHHAWSGEVARLLGGTIRPSKVWEAIADVWTRDVIGSEAASRWCESVLSDLVSVPLLNE